MIVSPLLQASARACTPKLLRLGWHESPELAHTPATRLRSKKFLLARALTYYSIISRPKGSAGRPNQVNRSVGANVYRFLLRSRWRSEERRVGKECRSR